MAYNGYYSNRPQKPEQWDPAEDTAGETETFVTRNVKLITFLVCLGVFLVFFGPWSVMRIMEWVDLREQQAQIEQTALTESELSEIAVKGELLDWSDFDGHHFKDLWETGMVIREYSVVGESFSIMVSAADLHAPLDSVLLVRKSDYADLELLTCTPEEALRFLGVSDESGS